MLSLIGISLLPVLTAAGSYRIDVLSHAQLPVLSTANEKGKGHSDCLIFNPSIIEARPPHNNRSGLLVRQCCGDACFGHGLRGESGAVAERISFVDCDLLAGRCSDPDPDFNLDPDYDTEDPRAVFNEEDGYYYLFYYGDAPTVTPSCKSGECKVQFSRSRTPTVASSWERIATLPWHRNGCCVVRPVGQRTVCIWGEGPGPFPGLGISTTTNFSSGVFTQVPWQNRSSSTPSPISNDSLWLLPLGADKEEIKLEGGTHMHQLSTGDLLTFYAAATPGWIPNGNYTVGWLVMDGEDPTRIVQRSEEAVLVPTWDYETLCQGATNCTYYGERKNVIFGSSAMPTGNPDEFRLYFGGGDGNVGTAVVRVSHSG
eukprot:Hpha_TRINITY_DN30935_c0_g1::TRINITY_DN30935_c0_g1_i1::g.112389::m.112389